MERFFNPSSVVVIGVSAKPTNLGKEIARNIFEFAYKGIVYLVGANGGVLFGRKIRASLNEITDPIDLAIILTPARTVPSILEQCGAKGIQRVVIESGGFGELDETGSDYGQALKDIAAKYGMRFIGPNCIGLINSSNGLATPFTALRNVFYPGGVGIIAQSGGVALSLLNMFHGERLGYSKFAAIGNKLNTDENDVLEYFVEDPNTSVICMYLESINDGRRLTDIARRSSKPIVVHKANIGAASQAIAQSHTEALANDDAVVDAALHQAGIVRFRDTQDYLDFVKILQLPEMKGRNLAIVSRSGGHAVMAADAAFLYGFQLPPFSEDFLLEIRSHLRADVIRLGNPLDLGDLFDFDVYLKILEHTIQQENVDGILFLHTYFASIEGRASSELLLRVSYLGAKYGKPIALCISTEQDEISRLYKEFDFPVFLSPERAVAALDMAGKRRQRQAISAASLHPAAPKTPPDDAFIEAALKSVAQAGRNPLLHEALEIIRSAGLNVPEFRMVTDSQGLEAAISDLPGPYAVKVVAESISHKSDAGGVVLGVPDAEGLRQTFEDMTQRFRKLSGSGFQGILIQRMIEQPKGSQELIVGGKRDPHFGPIVLLGHGGILVEVLGRMSLRMVPLADAELEEMIEDLPGSEIFKGVRGMPPLDRDALKDAILRIAHIMVRFPEIRSIDVNPILATPSAAIALDARIVL